MNFTQEIFEVYLWRFAAAILCGGIIGLERQLLGKTIGLRVCILVVLTTSFFVTMATEIAEQNGDIARVVAAVVTGVGFLGAGVIFRGNGYASGITTATLIWSLAAVGCAIGLGHPGVALIATLAVITVWLLVDAAEHFFPALRQNSNLRQEQGDD
ncbi:MgtC/SapB family protein [Roseibium sp.]|uniref:MgtC/SapB family protein n=1 Tax=Roseibium sp. TaxID=1936156 RepID=UPI003BAC4B54